MKLFFSRSLKPGSFNPVPAVPHRHLPEQADKNVSKLFRVRCLGYPGIEVLERKWHLRGDRLRRSCDAEHYLQTFTYVVPARLMAAQKNIFDIRKKWTVLLSLVFSVSHKGKYVLMACRVSELGDHRNLS